MTTRTTITILLATLMLPACSMLPRNKCLSAGGVWTKTGTDTSVVVDRGGMVYPITYDIFECKNLPQPANKQKGEQS